MAWKMKNDGNKNQKCYNCLFNNLGMFDKFSYSCLTCKDRPDRYKDKSEFIEDMTDETKEKSDERINRTGKYGY